MKLAETDVIWPKIPLLVGPATVAGRGEARSRTGSDGLTVEFAHPLAKVEGHGVHLGLIVAGVETAASSLTAAVIADEIGNVALNGGA